MSALSNVPTDLDQSVSKRIRSVRTRRGMTLKSVADELGIVLQQLHKYESGLSKVSVGTLIRLSEIFDCQISDLVPPEFKNGAALEQEVRVDLLKQDVLNLISECDSEQVLMALKTLLIGQASWPQASEAEMT